MSDINRTVQPQEINFGFRKQSDDSIFVAKSKALISCAPPRSLSAPWFLADFPMRLRYIYLKPVKTQLLKYGLTLDLMLFKHCYQIKA